MPAATLEKKSKRGAFLSLVGVAAVLAPTAT